MKPYVTFIILLIFSSHIWAKSSFTFHYKFAGESYNVNSDQSDYLAALKIAAHECFNHFKPKVQGNSEKGIDLIDVCANPKT